MNVMGPLDYLRARLMGTDDNPLGMPSPMDAHYQEPDPMAPPPPPADPYQPVPITSPGYRQPVG